MTPTADPPRSNREAGTRSLLDAIALGDPDERDPAQRVPGVAALVAGGSAAVDEALCLVEVQGGHGDAGACGQLTDGEFLGLGGRLGHVRHATS